MAPSCKLPLEELGTAEVASRDFPSLSLSFSGEGREELGAGVLASEGFNDMETDSDCAREEGASSTSICDSNSSSSSSSAEVTVTVVYNYLCDGEYQNFRN